MVLIDSAALAAARMEAAARQIAAGKHPEYLPIGVEHWKGPKLPGGAVEDAEKMLAEITTNEQRTGSLRMNDPDLRRAAESLVEAVTSLDHAERQLHRLAPATKA